MIKMSKIIKKLRTLLRKVLVSLGVVIAPYVAHAGYSMADRGPANTPINGTVRSLDTGDPIAGIRVNAWGSGIRNGGYETKTDVNGNFHLLVPEVEGYNIYFDDFDEELNSGFFGENVKRFEYSDIKDNLNILLQEKKLVTIHGFVLSGASNTAIPGIRIQLDMPTRIGYVTSSNSNGSFSIRVPEMENYKIFITDHVNDNFMESIKEIKLEDTKNSLSIVLEEEKYITIRGILYSKTTSQIIEGFQVIVSFLRAPIWAASERKLYTVITNNEGYFEVRIPERSNYILYIKDASIVYSPSETIGINKPVNDEIIKIYSTRF
jgi:hypothetical protein